MVLFDSDVVVFAYRVGKSLFDMLKNLMDFIGVPKVEFQLKVRDTCGGADEDEVRVVLDVFHDWFSLHMFLEVDVDFEWFQSEFGNVDANPECLDDIMFDESL